ncbi:MAG: NIPSNAP family protein [Pseudonocardiales bacterium]
MPTVYELRQYTLRPGTRDAFIAHFDEHFVESQEAAGISVVGQFRDLDRPDMFVWIRGFADMATRRDGLEQFYTGPAWRAHGQHANSMLLDSDNVLLLKPARPGSDWDAAPCPRAVVGSKAESATVFEVSVHPLTAHQGGHFDELYTEQFEPLLIAGSEITPIATLRTETAANTFPRLPVREKEHVFVTMSRFADEATYDTHVGVRTTQPSSTQLTGRVHLLTAEAPQILRLAPTPRSTLS